MAMAHGTNWVCNYNRWESDSYFLYSLLNLAECKDKQNKNTQSPNGPERPNVISLEIQTQKKKERGCLVGYILTIDINNE